MAEWHQLAVHQLGPSKMPSHIRHAIPDALPHPLPTCLPTRASNTNRPSGCSTAKHMPSCFPIRNTDALRNAFRHAHPNQECPLTRPPACPSKTKMPCRMPACMPTCNRDARPRALSKSPRQRPRAFRQTPISSFVIIDHRDVPVGSRALL